MLQACYRHVVTANSLLAGLHIVSVPQEHHALWLACAVVLNMVHAHAGCGPEAGRISAWYPGCSRQHCPPPLPQAQASAHCCPGNEAQSAQVYIKQRHIYLYDLLTRTASVVFQLHASRCCHRAVGQVLCMRMPRLAPRVRLSGVEDRHQALSNSNCDTRAFRMRSVIGCAMQLSCAGRES